MSRLPQLKGVGYGAEGAERCWRPGNATICWASGRLAVKDYQAAIAAGPNTSRADTARKRLNSPYQGN